jgi:surface protein
MASSYHLEKDINSIIKLVYTGDAPTDGTTYTISQTDVDSNGFSSSDIGTEYTIVNTKNSITTENASTVVTTIVTDMENLFYNKNEFNKDISHWDVANVTNMKNMFRNATAFNQYIGNWDVANVTNMYQMYRNTSAFNQDIGNWVVGNVTDMANMFNTASSFNQNIGNWDVTSVLDMKYMFYGTTAFNQDIGNWDVANATNISRMFRNAKAFNQNIRGWDVSTNANVVDMFKDATALLNGYYGTGLGTDYLSEEGVPVILKYFNRPLLPYYLIKYTNGIIKLFYTGTAPSDGTIYTITQTDVDSNSFLPDDIGNEYTIVDTSNSITTENTSTVVTTLVTDMETLFYNENEFNKDISHWDVANVTNMKNMFRNATAFNQYIGNWDVANVNTMDSMFMDAGAFNQNIGNWDVANVSYMEYMFYGATSFNQDLDGWDVSSVLNMSNMFYGATAFNGNIEKWYVGNVTDFSQMFSNASVFNQYIRGWDVSTNANVVDMFKDATALLNGEYGTSLGTDYISEDGVPLISKYFNQLTYYLEKDRIGIIKLVVYTKHAPSDGSTYTISQTDVSNNGFSSTDIDTIYTIVDTKNSITTENASTVVTTLVTDMDSLFNNKTEFNKDIGSWDVGNVTNMRHMFSNATEFNQYLGNWDVGNVTNMIHMFKNAREFNQNIRGWDVSTNVNVTDMFSGATALLNGEYGTSLGTEYISTRGVPEIETYFNQLIYNLEKDANGIIKLVYIRDVPSDRTTYTISQTDVSNNGFSSDDIDTIYTIVDTTDSIDIENASRVVTTLVTNMDDLFYNENDFNKDISHWDVANVTGMRQMFKNATSFNQDISGWDVGNVTDMYNMFNSAFVFNQYLGNWDVANVTEMAFMFYGARDFNQNIRGWDVSENVNVTNMFRNATALLSGDYGISLGTDYISTDGVPEISTYFNQVLGSSDGDPHIYPLYGSKYELPNNEGIYRMLEGEDLIINASTRKIRKEEKSEIKKYGKELIDNVERMIVDGCFYDKIYIKMEGNEMTFNYDKGELRLLKRDEIEISENVKKERLGYNRKDDYSEEIKQIVLKMNHLKYGKIILELNYFSNPQMKYGLGITMKKNNELSGLLVREYLTKSMRLDKLKDTRKMKGVVGKNEVHSKILVLKK